MPPPDAGQQLAVSDDRGADADYGPFERLFGVDCVEKPHFRFPARKIRAVGGLLCGPAWKKDPLSGVIGA